MPLKLPKLNKVPDWIVWTIIVLAFLGTLDALYLTASYYTGTELSCVIYKGCEEVAQSEYSQIYGIPLALFGMFYYATILFLGLLYVDTKKPTCLLPVIPLTAFGFLFSLYLTYLQIWVIEALCIYCVSSAVSSTLLFIVSMIIWLRYKNCPR